MSVRRDRHDAPVRDEPGIAVEDVASFLSDVAAAALESLPEEAGTDVRDALAERLAGVIAKGVAAAAEPAEPGELVLSGAAARPVLRRAASRAIAPYLTQRVPVSTPRSGSRPRSTRSRRSTSGRSPPEPSEPEPPRSAGAA